MTTSFGRLHSITVIVERKRLRSTLKQHLSEIPTFTDMWIALRWDVTRDLKMTRAAEQNCSALRRQTPCVAPFSGSYCHKLGRSGSRGRSRTLQRCQSGRDYREQRFSSERDLA